MSSRKEQKEQARIAREAKEQEHAAKQARTRRLSIIGGVIGLALIAVLVVVVVSTQSNKAGETKKGGPEANEVNARFEGIPQTFDTLGEPAAKATIVEFADLKCPFCAEWAEGSLPTVVDELVKTGKAKLVFRPLTIIDDNTGLTDSINAAKYAGATGLQNKLFPFIDLFYLNQGNEAETYATQSFLDSIGAQVDGLNTTEAWDNRENPKVTNWIKNASDEANEAGVTGTPSFFVGSSLEDALDSDNKVEVQSMDDPQAIIDAVNELQ